MSQNTTKTNRILLVAAALLLVLSAFTYRNSVQRADRFERGQKFLPTLNLDAVAEIELREGTADGTSTVVLRRTAGGDRFVVQSAGGYRADNAEVNRLLRKFLDLKLEKEVGEATGKLAERLGVVSGDAAPSAGTVEVALRGAADQDIVRFLLGDEFSGDGTSGRYLRRVGSAGESEDNKADTIYLTQGRVDLEVDGDSFVDQEILDIERNDIVALHGDGFVFSRVPKSGTGEEAGEEAGEESGEEAKDVSELGDLTLQGLGEGQKESSKARSVKGVLSPLRFTAHHLADAPEIQGLDFDRSLRVELNDGSGYELDLARSEDGEGESKAYLRIRAFHETRQVYVDLDASEDEVRKTSEVAQRVEDISAFNEYHGSWIYEVSTTVADRVGVEASELVDES